MPDIFSKHYRARGEHITPELEEYLKESLADNDQSIVIVTARGPGDGSFVGHVSLSIVNADEVMTINFRDESYEYGWLDSESDDLINRAIKNTRTALTPHLGGQVTFKTAVDHYNHAIAFALPRDRTDAVMQDARDKKQQLERDGGESITYSLFGHTYKEYNFNCVLYTRCLLKMMGIDANHLNMRHNFAHIPMPYMVNRRLKQIAENAGTTLDFLAPEYTQGENLGLITPKDGTMEVGYGEHIAVRNYTPSSDHDDDLSPAERAEHAKNSKQMFNLFASVRNLWRETNELLDEHAPSFQQEANVPAIVYTGYKMGRLPRGEDQRSWPFSTLHGLAAVIASGVAEEVFDGAVKAPQRPLPFEMDFRPPLERSVDEEKAREPDGPETALA